MAWLKLMRVANLPSALANILVGYLLANQSWQPTLPLVLLLIASACLYCAGMILNDVFDLEVDRQQRSTRPIAAGIISLKSATRAGYGMLIAGVLVASFAGILAGVIASLLAVAVWSYDGPLKKTIIAPAVMGLCRSLNILLGASTAVAIPDISAIPAIAVWYAIAIGVFVCGITLLARREADAEKVSVTLWPGSLVLIAGLVCVAMIVKFPGSERTVDAKFAQVFPWLIAFIGLPMVRRCVIALAVATPATVQTAVITCLRSLILLDASVCLLIAAGRPFYSVVVVSLLAISFLLQRVSKVT